MKSKRAVGHHARPPLFVAFAVAAAVAGPVLLAGGCRETPPSRTKTDVPVSAIPLADVIQKRAPELMKIPGVVGVAEGALPDGSPCLRIYVVAKNPEIERALPTTLDGWTVDIEESGPIEAMGDSA